MLRTNTEQNWNKSEISDSVVVFRRAARTNRRPDSARAHSCTTLDPRQNAFNCKREEEEDRCFVLRVSLVRGENRWRSPERREP